MKASNVPSRRNVTVARFFSQAHATHSSITTFAPLASPGFILPINVRVTPPLSPPPPLPPPCPLLILYLPSLLPRSLFAAPLLKISQVTQNWREIWQGPQVVRIVEKSPTYRGNLLTSHTRGGEARSCRLPPARDAGERRRLVHLDQLRAEG
ncbi:hypothetical protein E2C01_040190 [Portunus trituberculatus]|uniref:Uncharacterized protein n=1 Tax=Portunus trituberculatus TaxID=210409 RepID=A0A5B7FFT7_PORTR|nr:hypothetical protein [Portunus trituberculatus]